MANLTLTNDYAAGIYRIEQADYATGGEDGLSNLQAKQLGARTNFLKGETDGLKAREGKMIGEEATDFSVSAADNNKVIFLKDAGGISNITLSGNALITDNLFDGFKVTFVCISGYAAVFATAGAVIHIDGRASGYALNLEPGEELRVWFYEGVYYCFHDAKKNNGVPVGAMVKYGTVSELLVQGIWKACDGTAVSRTSNEFKRLFDVVGTIYGAGDGTTTFNLPNEATFMIKL